MTDKNYCMSSFLMYRTICDETKSFYDDVKPNLYKMPESFDMINNSFELEESLKKYVQEATKDGKAALALSGGIDSAILAKFMPKDSVAYTFKCVVPGIQVADESIQAAKYAKECGLEHKIIEIYWEDIEKYLPEIVKHKGAPCHSIEVQIYKAALRAKADGFDKLIFGESADCNYGGQSGLMSKDWTFGEFIERYGYVKPWHVLKKPLCVYKPISEYTLSNGHVDAHEFMRNIFFKESVGSYQNSCDLAQIELVVPFAYTRMNSPIDLKRVRNGENKYLVREVFNRLYPDFIAPPKIPMPRPVNEWFADWKGPVRDEFWPNCQIGMTGDQKWLIYVLERFLNIMENKE